MEEITRLLPDQALDHEQILHKAPRRWFRPPEVFEILSNHSKYCINPEPPVRPPDGSLLLFDRKVLRFFRKDGHNWRKKKDGKTVKEAHEKLKVGGVDALHCYYAHGKDNEKFQRRIYWMLDTQFEHIVLVHYREVKEAHKMGLSYVSDPGSQLQSPQSSAASWSEQPLSPFQASYTSTPTVVYGNKCGSYTEFGNKSSGYLGTACDVPPIQDSVSDDNLLLVNKGTDLNDVYQKRTPSILPLLPISGFLEFPKHNLISGLIDRSYSTASSSLGPDIHDPSETLGSLPNQKLHIDQQDILDFLSRKLEDARMEVDRTLYNVSRGRDVLFPETEGDTEGDIQVIDPSSASSESSTMVTGTVTAAAARLMKLDSFDRWMDREIGRDCDDSLTSSDSTSYWNANDTADNDKEGSSLSPHMQLDTDFLGPYLSQEQLFSISDFAPVWAYFGVEIKVFIIGTFLGDTKPSDGHKWCCMFGEIEVSCDVLSDNMIRCQVPAHTPGRVPFYVTCGNKLPCSEVREFEFLRNPLRFASPLNNGSATEEVSLQIRLSKLLCVGLDRKWLDCSVVECDKCKLKTKICTRETGTKKASAKSEEEELTETDCRNIKDMVIQDLLKDKLYDWLLCRAHEGDKGPHIVDDEGQGVIHLAASLGYVWALGPIIVAGVSPNYRDKQGRTSVQWASYFGREGAVITLIKLGADAGDGPTPEFQGGWKVSNLASDREIAGY